MTGSALVAGIVLAAGEGVRMGNKTKQLLPFRGQTLLDCVLDTALSSALQQIVVVLGHESLSIASRLEGKAVKQIFNPDYRQGQGSSIKAGLRALSGDFDAVIFMLGDQPLVTPKTVDLLISNFNKSPHPIVLPLFAGRRGNPTLFSRETFPLLLALGDDSGAKTLFSEYDGRTLKVPVSDSAIHFDVDTEDDYRRLLQK